MRLLCIFEFCMVFAALTRANPIENSINQVTEFTILHNNDIHARFEQTNKYGAVCTQEDANMNKCFGGVARVAHV